MRWPIALALLSAACARAEGTSTGSEESGPPITVRRVLADSPQRWPERYPAHLIDLPAGGVGITAGAEPSAEHPAGTAYVLEPGRGGSHLALAEWDLMTGTLLQRRALPFSPDGDDVPRVLHAGDGVHVVASGPHIGDTYYTLLDASFRVRAQNRIVELGGSVPRALASDGTVTFVVGIVPSYDGAPHGTSAYGATFDARGKPIGARVIPYDGHEFLLDDCAAVVGGALYLLRAQSGGLRLHQLTPDLKEVVSTLVPTSGHALLGPATLSARADGLVVDAPPLQFDFSLDLTQMRVVPRRPPLTPRWYDDTEICRTSTTIGPLYALLCSPDGVHHSSAFVAWDREEP